MEQVHSGGEEGMKKILIIYDYASVRELLTEELAADGHLAVPIGSRPFKEVIGPTPFGVH